jgi:tRNA(adenine34) deaminase
MNDTLYMKLAIEEANKAFSKNEVPVGAIIVCRGRVIARTHNMTEMLNDVTAHAEILAITSAANFLGGKYLNECTMYVSLEPCVMCAGAISWSQLGKLVYAASDTKKGYTTVSENILHPKTEVFSGILKNESENLLKSFFENKR